MNSSARMSGDLRASSTTTQSTKLLAARLAAFVLVMVGVRAVTISAVTIAELASDAPNPWWSRGSGVATVVATLVLAGLALALSRASLPLRALRAIDATLTILLALNAAFSIPIDPSTPAPLRASSLESHELKALLVVAHLLLLRAALVPSHPLRTAVLGIISSLVLSAGTTVAHLRLGIPSARAVPFLDTLVWSGISVIVSTACSAVIYGLRREVLDAVRLGQYTLEQKLGQGGMGTVFRARHALLRRPTAIKILSPERVSAAALERFEREVQLTALLSHPNVVSVYDFGRSEEGTFYYAMEFLDGVTLQNLVDSDGPQPASRVSWLLRQAAEALEEAHAVQLIHRDVKPANMIVTQRAAEADVLKLVDFGLVKELERGEASSLSGAHDIQGTPLYMAPEAILDPRNVSPRADLYALGAVGYFLLTGAPVFDGETAVEVLSKHIHAQPVPPSERVAGIPKKLEALLLRCLEKDPAQRFANARELLGALLECDDVPTWTPADAAAWWQGRKPVPISAGAPSPFERTLAIDLAGRGG
jgi:eukaryotic-like serine/threonine-protein kinase